MQILKKLLGGRPMTLTGQLFVDKDSGKDVHLYHDYLGRHWLAESRWSLFRVRHRKLVRLSRNEADIRLRSNNGWQLAPEEDTNTNYGYVFLEKLL